MWNEGLIHGGERIFLFPTTSRMFSSVSGHLRVWCSIWH